MEYNQTKNTNKMDKQIFVIEENYKTSKKEIVAYEYRQFIYDHAEWTTSPRGLSLKIHAREVDELWQIWTWGVNGNNPKRYDSQEFATEEEAEDSLFEIYEYQVKNSDQVSFFQTYEEAREWYIDNHCYCRHCSGTGQDYDDHSCSSCRGKGVIYEETDY